MNDVFLSFDVEDFINDRSTISLIRILELLKRFGLRGLFFITGHMAEKIQKWTRIVRLLDEHMIGYHSSSHSVRPITPEFTDNPIFEEAVKCTIRRETSHINPLTGEIEDKGGIELLREIFPDKEVNSFRAPGCCWTPPQMEAMRKLGIKFDFSGVFKQSKPIFFKGITFYPPPVSIENVPIKNMPVFLWKISKRNLTVLAAHPDFYVNNKQWDSIFHKSNPSGMIMIDGRSPITTKINFYKLNILLITLSFFKKWRITPDLEPSHEEPTEVNVDRIYNSSMLWCRKFFNYEPRFLLNHFYTYFKGSEKIERRFEN